MRETESELIQWLVVPSHHAFKIQSRSHVGAAKVRAPEPQDVPGRRPRQYSWADRPGASSISLLPLEPKAALNHHTDVNHIACIHTSPWPTPRDWPPLGRMVDGLIVVDQAQAAAAVGASGWPCRAVTIHFQP